MLMRVAAEKKIVFNFQILSEFTKILTVYKIIKIFSIEMRENEKILSWNTKCKLLSFISAFLDLLKI